MTFKPVCPPASLFLAVCASFFCWSGSAPPASAAPPAGRPELVLQLAHSGGVSRVCFSPDSSLISSSGGDGVAKVWDTRSHLLVREFATGEGSMMTEGAAIAFSSTGRALATGGKQLRFWELQSGKLLRTVDTRRSIIGVAFSRDGRSLALAMPNQVQLWTLPSTTHPPQRLSTAGECGFTRKRTFTIGTPRTLPGICFSRSGALLAIGSSQRVRLVSAHTGDTLSTIDNPRKDETSRYSRQPISMAFAPDNSLVLDLGGPCHWRPGKKIEVLRLESAGYGQGNALQFSNRGNLLLVGTQFLTWPGLKKANGLKSEEMDIAVSTLSPDGKLVATGTQDNAYEAHLWNAATGKLAVSWLGRNGGINDVSLSRDGRHLAAAADDGPLHVWNLETNAMRPIGTAKSGVRTVAFSPNNLLVAADNSTYDLRTGKHFKKYDRYTEPFEAKIPRPASGSATWYEGFGGEVNDYSASPDGRLVAGAAGDFNDPSINAVEIWAVSSGKLLRRLPSDDGVVRSVCFTRDGKTLIAGYDNGALRYWDTSSWKPRRTVLAHGAHINNLRLTAEGRHLLSAANDYTVKIWDPGTGSLQATIVILPPAKEFTPSVDWMVYTPAGLYDGSARAEVFLRWRIGGKLQPASAGHKLRTSHLLQKLLGTSRTKPGNQTTSRGNKTRTPRRVPNTVITPIKSSVKSRLPAPPESNERTSPRRDADPDEEGADAGTVMIESNEDGGD